MLLRAGRADEAVPLLLDALGRAERIGMPTLIARLRRLGFDVDGRARAPDDLSAREVDVLNLVARGLSNREIGQRLHLSEHTVANHVRSILRKTRTANRTEAASYAHRTGLAAG
jgi:DNA-binding NarL/FixJ family response regulator